MYNIIYETKKKKYETLVAHDWSDLAAAAAAAIKVSII